MEGRDIPGFFYDPEKKKYFAIKKPGSFATDSVHSANDVKRRKISTEKKAAEDTHVAKEVTRIKRLGYSRTLGGSILERDFGRKQQLVEDGPQTILSGFRQQRSVKCHIAIRQRPNFPFAVSPSSDKDGTGQIFKQDDVSQCRYVYDLSKTHSPMQVAIEGLIPDGGSMTSISINEATGHVATTYGSATSAICIVPLEDTDNARIARVQRGLNYATEEIFASAPAPSCSSAAFAFGSDSGAVIVEKANANWIASKRVTCDTSCLAVDFLPNTSVLLAGHRSGILKLQDLRVKEAERDTIKHPSAIAHITVLDMHRILAAGPKSSLCQYDLRYRKQGPSPSKKRSRHDCAPTVPCLQYPEYHSPGTTFFGFDVDLDSKIIATAAPKSLEFFSLFGGQKLRAPADIPPTTDGPARYIRFVEDEWNKPKSLWTNNYAPSANGGRGTVLDLARISWASFGRGDIL